MKPRKLKLNAHTQLEYYTPGDVEAIVKERLAKEKDALILRAVFGLGELRISTGTFEGAPAVLIAEMEKAGTVGDNVPKDTAHKLRAALIFPTTEQAHIVQKALVGDYR